MAKPIALSAAAMVNINIATIWPNKSSKKIEKITKLMLAANNKSSKDINIIMIWLLNKNVPKEPIINIKLDNIKYIDISFSNSKKNPY
jgi:hypothetical protein